MNASSSASIVQDWIEFEANWIADGLAFLKPVLDRALEGHEFGTVLLPDAVHSGRLIELLAPRASWVVCLEEGEAASRLMQRELLSARIQNASVTPGALEALSLADETFEEAIWVVPPMLSVRFRDQVAQLARALKPSGSLRLLVVPDPQPEASGESEMQAEAARLDALVTAVAEGVQISFGAVGALAYSARSEAPGMEAFRSAVFRAKQPRGADRAEVERALGELKKTYDGGLSPTGSVKVLARGAIVKARKR